MDEKIAQFGAPEIHRAPAGRLSENSDILVPHLLVITTNERTGRNTNLR